MAVAVRAVAADNNIEIMSTGFCTPDIGRITQGHQCIKTNIRPITRCTDIR